MIGPRKTVGLTVERDRRGLVTATEIWDKVPKNQILSVAAGNPPLGLQEIGRKSTQRADAFHRVAIQYEGHSPGTGGTSLPVGPYGNRAGAVYELDVDLEDVPIEAHPEIQTLMDKYNGRVDNGRVVFDLLLTSGVKGSAGLSGAVNASGKGKKNPFFNLTNFLRLGSIFRASFITDTFPSDVFDKVGTIVRSIGLFEVPKHRVWLVMPPRISARGNCFETFEELKLVPDDPSYVELYDLLIK